MDMLNGKMSDRWADVVDHGMFVSDIELGNLEKRGGVSRRAALWEGPKRYVLDGSLSGVHLTRREAECMYWVLQGYTNQQIADQMALSARTVEYYIKNMRRKSGAHSKVQLMNWVAATSFLKQVVSLYRKDGRLHEELVLN